MKSYLISFVLCSGVLLLVYHLFLSRENLYRFNRFYLLLCLVFSMIVPVITVKIPRTFIGEDNPIVERIATVSGQKPVAQIADRAVESAQQLPALQPISPPANNMPYILFAVYLIIALILLIRFISNIHHIKQKINKSTTQEAGNATLVLLDEDITPHSFLNYIFINKGNYHSGLIEPEIVCHEQAHVRQFHSVDVIIVELLQIVCWFNPFMPFYRKAIQLNHEFLADETVIKNYEDTPAYQHLLLAKAQQGNSLYLTSQFNYLTIKKRLIMMTKTTSVKMALYKKLALLPVLAGTLLLFCHKVMAYGQPIMDTGVDKPGKVTGVKEKDTVRPRRVLFPVPSGSRTKYNVTDAPRSVMDAYQAILKKYNMQDGYGNIKDITDADTTALHGLFVQMSIRQQDGQLVRFSRPLLPSPKNTVSKFWIAQWQKDKNYEVWIDGKQIKNDELTNYKPDDFDHYKYNRLHPKSAKNDALGYRIDLMTRSYYADYYKAAMANRADRLEPLQEQKK